MTPNGTNINGVKLPPLNPPQNSPSKTNHLQPLLRTPSLTEDDKVEDQVIDSSPETKEESSAASSTNEDTVVNIDGAGREGSEERKIHFNMSLESRENSLNSLLDEDELFVPEEETHNEDGRWTPVNIFPCIINTRLH